MPLFITDLNLFITGLNRILAHETDLSSPLSNHLQTVTEVVVTVIYVSPNWGLTHLSSLEDPDTPPQLT